MNDKQDNLIKHRMNSVTMYANIISYTCGRKQGQTSTSYFI